MNEDLEHFRHRLPSREGRRPIHYVCFPFLAIKAYFQRTFYVFGVRFCLYLIFSQFVLKGVLMRVVASSMLPIFKNMGIDAVRLQLFTTIVMSPWALKPFVGVLSDVVTLGGYHKRYYIICSNIFGVSGCIVLVALEATHASTALAFVGSFFLVNLELSVTDLLTEGKYAQLMRDNPQSGSDIITFVNGLQMLGGIIAMAFVGPMGDHALFLELFIIALVLATIPVVPTFLGWLPEDKKTQKCCNVDIIRFSEEWRLFLVVVLTGFSAPIITVVTTFGNRFVGVALACVILLGVILAAYRVFPLLVFKVAVFLVLSQVTKPSIGTAMDYWFTADDTCLPDGPHFSYAYYISFTGILGSVFSFLAVWIYQAWLSRWKFRNVLIFTASLSAAGGLVDLIIILRWNVTYLHIPDKYFYVMGEAILESVVSMLYWIPSSAIISKVCPSGLESTTYAFLAGLSNFSGLVSQLAGALIFEAAGVQTVGSCDFSNLWILVVVCHISAPLAGGVISAWVLIPNVEQTKALRPDGREEITEVMWTEDDDEILFE